MKSLPHNYHNRINEIIERLTITEVWKALGGGELKHRRGKAFWRKGDGCNVSLSDAKGAWYDHVRNEGGGILALVELVLQCDRKAALEWLADFAGVPLEHLSPEQRREYARQRDQARIESEALVYWKADMLLLLRDHRDWLQETVLRAQRWGLAHINDERLIGDPRWEAVWYSCMTTAQRVEDLNTEIDRVQAASYAELLPLFRARRRELAA